MENVLMNTSLTDEELEKRARRRVEAKMGFYVHAFVFVLVNLGLLVLNLLGGGPRWHVWPLFGWGLGLAIHGLVVFLGPRTDGLRARMLAEERERIRSGR
jgi:hypothetical protein